MDLPRLRRRILDWQRAMGLAPPGSEPWFLRFGSTAVMVTTFERDGRCFVRFTAPVLAGCTPTLELLTRLLHLNAEVILGAFLLLEGNDLSFAATLPAEALDQATFAYVLEYVARVSDEVDEGLQGIAGGHRATEILDGEG